MAAVLVALVITRAVSASLGGAPNRRAIMHDVIDGAIALVVTYVVGHLVGAVVA